MFPQNLESYPDEHQSAGQLRPLLKEAAQPTPQQPARQGEGKGHTADDQGRPQDIHMLEKRHRDAHGQGIDAGGHSPAGTAAAE